MENESQESQDNVIIERIDKQDNLSLNYKKNKKKKFFKLLILLLFFISYLLYFLSLQKCYLGFDLCSTRLGWIRRKVREEICSSIFMSILIELIIYKKIKRFHLIHIIIIFIIFYIYSHGLDFDDHGRFNFIFYFVLLFLFIICFLPFNLLIYLIKKKRKKTIIIYCIFSTIIIITLYSFTFIFSNCDEWPMGLNNTIINNNISCKIHLPIQCPYKYLSGFQNFTKIRGINCKNKKDGKINLLKQSNSPFINHNTTHIGYPLTNKDPTCLIDFIDNNNLIKKYFFNNLVDIENNKILNEYFKEKMPEIEVDFSDDKQGKMFINVNYNKTLSEERLLLEKNTIPHSNNIMVLYVDSVSRANSLRQLKKTTKFFENFMPYKGNYNKKFPSENFHSFQFFKYHCFLQNTKDNYPLIFYGQPRNKNIVSITKYFKENGYVTSYSGDYCDKDNVRTFHNLTLEEIHDHQFIMCDPNLPHYNLVTIKCLYGKQAIEHIYEYSNQFWRKYYKNRKFMSIVTNEGHEGTLQAIRHIDDVIFNFLNNLFNDNLLKDSSVILISDHGVGIPSLYYYFDFYKTEHHLPMLYMIVNDRKNISYEEQYKYIYENQQIFVTAYDVYNTLSHLLYGDKYAYIENKTINKKAPKSENGKSLFEEIDPKERFPKFYKNIGNIPQKYCK